MRLLVTALALVLAALLVPSAASAQERERLPSISVQPEKRIGVGDKVDARMLIRGERRGGYRGLIGIDHRGSSSLQFPKRSYGFELRDREGEDRDAGLLGMPPDDDWILLPSYNEKTLMRNALALSVGRALGGWHPRARFVQLRVNGRYWGVYLLTEDREINDRRLDAGSEGQLYELTDFGREYEEGYFLGPTTDRPIEFKDPEAEDFSAERRQELIDVIGRFEAALYGSQSHDPQAGWRAHLDERSAVHHAIVQEALKNEDGFSASAHIYKQEDAGLFLGPVWDFDIAMGNSNVGESAVIPGWMGDDRPWSDALYDDPGFRRAFAERWRRLRAGGFVEKMIARIDRWQRLLDGEQQRNFRRWRVLGKYVWPNPFDPATGEVRQTYREEVDFLRSWLRERARWIDANVDSLGS